MKFWNFKNKDENTGELMLYGDISSSTWWGDEVTPKDFKKDLDELGEIKNLNIYINSGGGDVFAGTSIHNMLKRHSAFKTVYIDGLAASIASVIAMAGDKIVMPKNSMMMIHQAWTSTYGNKKELRKMADTLEQVDASISTAYKGKTGLEDDEIMQLMEEETWFTAEEAFKKGFADEVEEAKQIAASIDGGFLLLNNQKFEIKKYKNMPKLIITNENREDKPQPVSDIESQQQEFFKLRKKINLLEE